LQKPVADMAHIGAKYRLLTVEQLDGRTSAAKHARQLIGAFESDLGGKSEVSVAERELVRRAAVIGTILSDYETRWLLDGQISLADYLPAVNAQRRVLEAIGLKRRPRQVEGIVELMARAAQKRREAEDAA